MWKLTAIVLLGVVTYLYCSPSIERIYIDREIIKYQAIKCPMPDFSKLDTKLICPEPQCPTCEVCEQCKHDECYWGDY